MRLTRRETVTWTGGIGVLWASDHRFARAAPQEGAVGADVQGPEGHCQSKFYTARSRTWAGWRSIVFVHKSPTHSARFDAENGLYLFALTSAP